MKTILTFLIAFCFAGLSFGQNVGDFQSISDGNWDVKTNWQTRIPAPPFWIPANSPPPSSLSGTIQVFVNNDIALDGTVPSVTVGASAKLIINSGSLTVLPSGSITNNGTLTNSVGNSGLVLQSDASGTANLISGSSPSGTLQCYVSSGAWHLIGPPNNSLNASDAFLTGYMQTWSDGNPGSWTVQEGNPALSLGEGAAYYFFSNFTASMDGSLNGAAKTFSGLSNAGGGDDGWHLLANPFPCGVDLTACTFSGLGTERYVYNGSSYVQKTDLAPSQGFFVRVTSSGNFTFPVTAKTTDNSNIEKSGETDFIKLQLMDVEGISNDELIVRFNENATEGFDTELDGLKLIGSPNAGEFMAELETDLYAAISAIPFPNQISSVPVYFKKGNATEYTISMVENELQNMEVTLFDIQNEQEISLGETSSYTFTANEPDSKRFLLHFKNASSVAELDNNSQVQIRQTNDFVIIEQQEPQQGEIRIFDISGKVIKTEPLSANNIQRVSFAHQPNGIYIVKLTFDHVSYSQKIIK